MNFEPQPKQFRYTLNIRGVITQVLGNSPDGWLNNTIKYTRSTMYGALQRTFTTPLKFVFLGRTLLLMEFYRYWFLSITKVLLEERQDDWSYKTLFSGKIDYSTAKDNLTEFAVNAKNDDFSTNLDGYDTENYLIPMDADEAINLELTPLILKEQATVLPQPPPDGNIHSDYFPPMQIVNNQQNSVNASVQNVIYRQFRLPDFSTDASWFYHAQLDGKIYIQGSLTINSINGLNGNKDIRLDIRDQSGAYRYKILEYNPIGNAEIHIDVVNIDIVLTLNKGDRLFLYMQVVNPEADDLGMTITGGQLNLSYQTTSPASMCKALPVNYVYKQLLQAMNNNTDSGPNQPVPNQSYLMDKGLNPAAILKNVYIICSDNIRAAVGSIYKAGDSIFQGVYLVISGTVTYNGNNFNAGEKFTYVSPVTTFTGDGIAQKTQDLQPGNVYNPGDTLESGGTYLVGGNTGDSITYNNIVYPVGQFFTYVLGQDTFTANSDDGSEYVQQTAEATQLGITYQDYFQSIKSLMGGDCEFGYDPAVQKWCMEQIGYFKRVGISTVDLGEVSDTWEREPAIDMLGCKIKAGYKDQQYDKFNGSQESNSEQDYTSPCPQPNTEINLQSVIRGDPLGIEQDRVSMADTAASRSDNNPYFVYVKDEPEATIELQDGSLFTYYHPLRTETLSSIVGVDPSYYNWKISPKQNLLRGSRYLASIFYFFKGYELTQTYHAKNNGMVTIDLDGNRVAEADPIIISSLGQPYFIPIYCNFTPGTSQDIMTKIDASPFAEMSATVNGVKVLVFSNEIAVDTGSQTAQDFKTLLSPNNDVLKFIN